MRWAGLACAAFAALAAYSGCATAQTVAAPEVTDKPAATAAPAPSTSAGERTGQRAESRAHELYVIRYDHWTDADERAYGEFIRAIGESGCHTVDSCLRGPWNPFRASDAPTMHFVSDCAELPYVLRAYFAWKRALPFSYEREVTPRSHTNDLRYTREGNEVTARTDVLSGSTSGYELLGAVREQVWSASFRIHPDLDEPLVPDMYSPAISVKSIRPGTMFYDPNGHVGTIFRVDPDGRLEYIDAHPDSSVTRGFYDQRFVRSRPGMGAGFKNWRPMVLEGASRRGDGVLVGGHIALPRNKDIPDFSEVQYFGTGTRPDDDSDWSSGGFVLNGETLDYYDYVRAILAGGKLQFDPVKEFTDMVVSNCNDLHYRADAVNVSIAAGTQNWPEPERLPPNIYGTEGDWETFSTPSRDARLKTSFKELLDQTKRFVHMFQTNDPKLVYKGSDLVDELIAAYDRNTASCSLTYPRSNNSPVTLNYLEMQRRLFLMSFDPYQCIEHRWGATAAGELATCKDGGAKQAWYAVEQNLRNQIDRTYDARMDFTLEELKQPGPGKGVATPPNIDVRGYLVSVRGAKRGVVQAALPRS